MLSWVEHEKSFTTSGPEVATQGYRKYTLKEKRTAEKAAIEDGDHNASFGTRNDDNSKDKRMQMLAPYRGWQQF